MAKTSSPPAEPIHLGQSLCTLKVETEARTQIKDITADVLRVVDEAGVESGLCCLYIPHTTAGILINENDDPAVVADIAGVLDRIAPQESSYKHREGNADSHLKAALTGTSETIPIEDGKLTLGQWQGIFFCEFDGPRRREVKIRILRETSKQRS